jgi:hypothetical protein
MAPKSGPAYFKSTQALNPIVLLSIPSGKFWDILVLG